MCTRQVHILTCIEPIWPRVFLMRVVSENRELSKFQLYRHWRHCSLTKRQPVVLPVTTKWVSWRLPVFSGCHMHRQCRGLLIKVDSLTDEGSCHEQELLPGLLPSRIDPIYPKTMYAIPFWCITWTLSTPHIKQIPVLRKRISVNIIWRKLSSCINFKFSS